MAHYNPPHLTIRPFPHWQTPCSIWNGKPTILALGTLNDSALVVMDNDGVGYLVNKSSFIAGKSIDLTSAEPFHGNSSGWPNWAKSNGLGAFVSRYATNHGNIFLMTKDKKRVVNLMILSDKLPMHKVQTLPLDTTIQSHILISSDKEDKVYVLKGTDLFEASAIWVISSDEIRSMQ